MALDAKKSETFSDNDDTLKKPKQEIYYNGYFYDVTHFVDRHPGGNLIKFFTEDGEDATEAIEQFHFRSKNKVQAILKSFKRRPALPHERRLDAKALAKHDTLSQDFKKLFEELQAEGYFEPCLKHVLLRFIEGFSMAFIAYGLAFKFIDAPFTIRFFVSMFHGYSLSRFGWIEHEGGHRSLTGIPRIDGILQDISLCLMTGGSSVWWNSQHNRHHAMPQRLQHDVDLSTLPYVAFHKRTVRSEKEIYKFFVKYQHIFYFTLDMFVVTIAWKFVLHPRYQLKKKAYFELLLNLPILIAFFYFGPVYYFMTSYFFAFFMGTNFALNHSHLEVADKPTHWVEYSLTHTANITSSIFVDYWMGYLNYQIEHHLFPTMPQFRQKEISHKVKALAEKHGLPYRVYSYPEACKLAINNLADVGKQLTENRDFSKNLKEL